MIQTVPLDREVATSIAKSMVKMMLKAMSPKEKAELLTPPAAALAKKAIDQHPSIHAIAIGLPQINLGLLHFRHELVI